MPIIVVSDTKKHDTYFVRYFLTNQLLGEDGWLQKQEMETGLAERIRTIHIDSDGAAAHFKQRGSLHHITYLTAMYGLQVTWTFGCPGHGKGQWDGLGGTVKNKTGNYLKAYDKFMPTAHSVYEVIYELFASPTADAIFDSKTHVKIKRWKVLWLPDEALSRPVSNTSNAGGKKSKKKSIQKSPIHEGGGEEKAVDEVEEGAEDDNEKNEFSKLQGFHDAGTRSIFFLLDCIKMVLELDSMGAFVATACVIIE